MTDSGQRARLGDSCEGTRGRAADPEVHRESAGRLHGGHRIYEHTTGIIELVVLLTPKKRRHEFSHKTILQLRVNHAFGRARRGMLHSLQTFRENTALAHSAKSIQL